MKIAILGTGSVGRKISVKLIQIGHSVTMGTRDVEVKKSDNKVDTSGNPSFKDWHANNPEIKVKTFDEAAIDAELIFNCTAGMVSITALEMVGEENLNGKILIDVANPLDFNNGMPPSLNPVNTDSLGEQIQNKFPKLFVVKTLNTMSAHLMVNPALLKGNHNVFVCGNDEHAKGVSSKILQSFGWQEEQIIDLGDISNSRGTEMLLPIWLRLWNTFGTANFNFLIQR